MNFFEQLAQNRIFWVAVASWFAAQGLKVVFGFIVERRWDLSRFFGLGGMPSSHSSVVCSVATAVGIQYSFASALFAVSFVFACVVMTDAAGVRRAAGKQAAVLNKIVQDMIANGRGLTTETLKELLGHTPFEVVVGALLGILLAILIM
ncbi:MAG: divergent PAP2 family protein [Clostridia bacterium]|nr:divergent PAP2 family protein [Clostridia bacterium]